MAIDPPRATGISVVRVLWLQIAIKLWKGAALVGYIRRSDNIILFADHSYGLMAPYLAYAN
jgi:hypothetical protein